MYTVKVIMFVLCVADDKEDAQTRRHRHGMLKVYYGMDMEKERAGGVVDVTDINGMNFKPGIYLDKLLKVITMHYKLYSICKTHI